MKCARDVLFVSYSEVVELTQDSEISALPRGGVISHNGEEHEQSTGSRVEYLVVPRSLQWLKNRWSWLDDNRGDDVQVDSTWPGLGGVGW